MMFFRALAFTQIDGSPSAIGNPANVVLFNNMEEMNGEMMSQISTGKLPLDIILLMVKNSGFAVMERFALLAF
jgi:hypothetical protein